MESHLISKYAMYLKTDDFFQDHAADTAGHAQIALKYPLYSAKVVAIGDAMGVADADNTGVTEDKAAQRIDTEQKIFFALTAVASFARDNNNRTLMRNVDFTLSELKKLRDPMLYAHGKKVEEAVIANIAALAPYAYTAGNLLALTTSLALFLAIMTEPKDAIEESAAYRLELARLYRDTDVILEDLDGYMDSYRFSNPLLWDEYKMARAIDDAGGGSGGSPDHSNEGVLNPSMSEVVLNFTYDPDYTFSISNLGPGMSMEARLQQDGVDVPGAAVRMVAYLMPASGLLSTWGASGNQITLRNLDMMQLINYSVSLKVIG